MRFIDFVYSNGELTLFGNFFVLVFVFAIFDGVYRFILSLIDSYTIKKEKENKR